MIDVCHSSWSSWGSWGVEGVEDRGQEGAAQEVPQGGQVGDGGVVRVLVADIPNNLVSFMIPPTSPLLHM